MLQSEVQCIQNNENLLLVSQLFLVMYRTIYSVTVAVLKRTYSIRDFARAELFWKIARCI